MAPTASAQPGYRAGCAPTRSIPASYVESDADRAGKTLGRSLAITIGTRIGCLNLADTAGTGWICRRHTSPGPAPGPRVIGRA